MTDKEKTETAPHAIESGMRGCLVAGISDIALFGIYLDGVYFILMNTRLPCFKAHCFICGG